MNNEEINKIIHRLLTCECDKCGKPFDITKNLDFTTSWEAFGILWEWWQKHPKFENFRYGHILFPECADSRGGRHININVISPRTLAEATVEFFKEEQK